MFWTLFERWINAAPVLVIAGVLLAAVLGAGALGRIIGGRRKTADEKDDLESFLTSSVFGLLALLMGFTFALAIDRYEFRRVLVQQEANAIGTAYARADLLGEPHRTRVRELLLRYTRNRIALGGARPADMPPLLAANDRLIGEFWAASAAAFPSIQHLDFSSAFIEGVNEVIQLEASRKSARLARVPLEVFALLIVYVIASAGVLGVVARGRRAIGLAALFLALLTLSLALIIDIDRPAVGGVRESQGPMLRLLQQLGQ